MNTIVGRNPVLEALRSETPIEKIIFLHGVHGESIQQIRTLARQKNIPFVEHSQERFNKISQYINSQGVIAIIGEKIYCDIDELFRIASSKNEKPFFLIFDEIEDTHNIGALIRTAVCAGVHGGIIPKHHSAPINETVVKTSAGASEHFPIAKVTNLVSAIEELKEKNVWIVGTEMSVEKSYTELDYNMSLAIVVGNEGKGMRRLVKEKCDFLVKIPMVGKIQSLNVSVAGALMMYEVMRGRKK